MNSYLNTTELGVFENWELEGKRELEFGYLWLVGIDLKEIQMLQWKQKHDDVCRQVQQASPSGFYTSVS